MTSKLDPSLETIACDPDSRAADQEVAVIIGLNVSAGPGETRELEASGVTTRSIIGDIVTGKISVSNLRRLELIPWVVKVESSTLLGPG